MRRLAPLLILSACGLELRGAGLYELPQNDAGMPLNAATATRDAGVITTTTNAAAAKDSGAPNDGGDAVDAGMASADDASTKPDSSTRDAGNDAGKRCTPVTDNDFSTLGNWEISRTKPLSNAVQNLQLTNEAVNQRGAVFWKTPTSVLPPGGLEMTLVFSSMTATSTKRGNGFGFVFAAAPTGVPTIMPALVPTGVGACMNEVGVAAGYALIFSTAQSPAKKPTLNLIKVNDCAGPPVLAATEVPVTILNGASHTLRAEIQTRGAQTTITAMIDNESVWQDRPVDIAVSGSLYFGATAATGKDPNADKHFVQSLKASVCD